jgi:hypothetical protein
MIARVKWIAPKTDVNGKPITGKLTYNLYQFSNQRTIFPVVTGITTTEHDVTDLPINTTQCFYVRAVINGHVSAGSNIACVKIRR